MTKHESHWQQHRQRAVFAGWRLLCQASNERVEAMSKRHMSKPLPFLRCFFVTSCADAVERSTLRSWLTHARYIGHEDAVMKHRE